MEHAVIRLKAGEKTPFYEQIYAYFAAAIRSGALAAGEKLPSKRRLAQDVGVSISTVETAYAMLVAEGYLEAKPRSGFRVCSLSALQRPVTPAPSPAEPVQTPPRFDFSTGRVDTTLFPFAAWRRLKSRTAPARAAAAARLATPAASMSPVPAQVSRTESRLAAMWASTGARAAW